MDTMGAASVGGAFRTLWNWEKPDYVAHLIRLDSECRRLRFHGAMSDERLARHADHVFSHDDVDVVGWFKDGVLRGAAEVAVFATASGREAEAAFAIEYAYRRNGVGRALMERAALHARNLGATDLHIATDRENRAMIGLARSCGATFEINDTEADGVLHNAPRTVFSIALETIEQEIGVAQWAYDTAGAWLGRQIDRIKRAAASL